MFDLESGNFLRIALAGGIIGFAVFCAFYSFTVWQRRNRAGATLLSTLSLLLIVTGVLGTAFFWLANNLTAREGIVEGSDLFVVRTKRDTSIHSLIDAEEVQEGTILAAYSRPGMENRIAVLDSRINEANARLLAVDVRSLPVDQTLLQRYWDLRSQIGQARSFRFELQRSQRDIEKDKLEALAARTREQEAAKMEAAIAQEAFKAATGRLRMAHAAAARADALRKRAIIPVQDIEARQGDVLVFKMEQETAQSKIALYKQRIISLQAHYAQYLKTLDQQTAAINQDIGSVDERLTNRSPDSGGPEPRRNLRSARQRSGAIFARRPEG